MPKITYSSNHSIHNIKVLHHIHKFNAKCHIITINNKKRDFKIKSSITTKKLEPVTTEVSVFSPATIANLGPGFDWLGCAIKGDGDIVTAVPNTNKNELVVIEEIEGDDGKLPLNASKNCVGIAAIEALKLLGSQTSCGVSLKIKKGLPLGSGLGSSAASSAAGAAAVNSLFGDILSKEDLISAGLVAEATVSGYHADNIAPAILGGFVMVKSMEPLELISLTYPHNEDNLWFVLVTPEYQAPTAEMRAVLPKDIKMKESVFNCNMGGVLVAGILKGNKKLIGSSMNSDKIVEVVRGPLIPGFTSVKANALNSGAYGCTISGAGPTVVAIVENERIGEIVAEAMCKAFVDDGKLNIQKSQIVQLNEEGTITL